MRTKKGEVHGGGKLMIVITLARDADKLRKYELRAIDFPID